MTDRNRGTADSRIVAGKRTKYKRRRARGEGSVVLRHGAFHLLYRDAEGNRKSSKLHEKDDYYFSVTCDKVRDLALERLKELTAPIPALDSGDGSNADDSDADTLITDYWEKVYLPWARTVNPGVNEPNLRPSTLQGYLQIWAPHLKSHFEGHTLRGYKTVTATHFLTSLAAAGKGRNTCSHIRSLMSGIFTSAIRKGILPEGTVNPIANAGVDGKTKRPAKTGHYSLQEALAILKALSDHVECQLIMSLAFFWGLRPGEIRGLKYEDFWDSNSEQCPVCIEDETTIEVPHVHIRRSIDKQGNEGKPKTEESEQPLPLMLPIAMPLQIWREQCGNPTEGWVFRNGNDKPTDINVWVRTRIRPALSANKLKWKSLYAGRRGAATMLLQLTGNALASQQMLRHKPGSAVTARHYLKALPDALLQGSKLVEQAVAKALKSE